MTPTAETPRKPAYQILIYDPALRARPLALVVLLHHLAILTTDGEPTRISIKALSATFQTDRESVRLALAWLTAHGFLTLAHRTADGCGAYWLGPRGAAEPPLSEIAA